MAHATLGTDDWWAAFREHEAWLRRVLFNRIGDRDAVDDLVQEIGLAASRDDLRPDDPAKFPGWLYRVAIRQSYLYRRRAGRYRKLVQGAAAQTGSAVPTSPDPMSWVLGEERAAGVRDALDGLSEMDREILLLKYVENWSYQDLADRLGVTRHTVEHRLLRAKEKLRRQLSEQQIERP